MPDLSSGREAIPAERCGVENSVVQDIAPRVLNCDGSNPSVKDVEKGITTGSDSFSRFARVAAMAIHIVRANETVFVTMVVGTTHT